MSTCIIFDTETTGINEPAIVEAAYIVIDSPLTMNVTSTFCQRYNPGKPIEFGAMATHFITNADVDYCPPASQFSLPDGVEYIIGHNVDFDCDVIGNTTAKRICTLAMARKLFPECDSHKQSALILFIFGQKYINEIKHAHAADKDVGMCGSLLNYMIKHKLPHVQTWEDLYQFSEHARIPDVMPFGKHKGEKIAQIPADYVRWLRKQSDVDKYLLKSLDLYF